MLSGCLRRGQRRVSRYGDDDTRSMHRSPCSTGQTDRLLKRFETLREYSSVFLYSHHVYENFVMLQKNTTYPYVEREQRFGGVSCQRTVRLFPRVPKSRPRKILSTAWGFLFQKGSLSPFGPSDDVLLGQGSANGRPLRCHSPGFSLLMARIAVSFLIFPAILS